MIPSKYNILFYAFACTSICFFMSAFTTPSKEYKIFQFHKNSIPRIDGDFSDWEMVPNAYAIGLDQLKDTRKNTFEKLDPKDYDITVKVGWVKNLNRLYFYVEASDDYWSFNDPKLAQDIFELVVDGNLSGGPFIKKHNGNTKRLPYQALHFKGHGAHAQNYHIFTPVKNKDEVMIWGNTPWIKEFPYYNAAYNYNFEHGESGTLKMEFWITPFDHADEAGIDRSTVTQLKENNRIGMSWCILDYDTSKKFESFLNLANHTNMIYDASYLNLFRLMPIEDAYKKSIDAQWSFIEIDRKRRWFQFKDASSGSINKWHWDFGDGTTSSKQNPAHCYTEANEWTVILTVEWPEGKSIRSKVWDVVTE